MRKPILSLLFAILSFYGGAQLSISSQLPPSGLLQKDGLWNVMLINNGTTTVEGTLLVSLQDALTGQVLLSGGGRAVTIPKGVKMLSVRDVQPVQYTYTGIAGGGSALPAGNYTVCYSLHDRKDDYQPLLATECVRLSVTPLSPVLLNYPLDKDTLPIAPSQFSWLPPAPLEMFSGITYDMAVAEVLPGQSPTQALLYNTPVYARGSIPSTYEPYPSSYSRLTIGKTYAWQVTARSGLTYSQPTEVWSFTISGESSATAIGSKSYIELKGSGEETGITHLSGTAIHLKYYSFDKEGVATIRLLSGSGEQKSEYKQNLVYGNNFFSLPLPRGLTKGVIYKIELIDAQKRSIGAHFSLQ